MRTSALLILALVGLATADSTLLSVFQPGQPFPEIFVSADGLGRVAQGAGDIVFTSANQTHQCSSVTSRNSFHATEDVVLLCEDIVPQDWTSGAPVTATIGAGIKPVHVGYVFSHTSGSETTQSKFSKRSLSEHDTFIQWAELFISGQTLDESEGVTLAKNRMSALKKMLKSDAEAACHLRIPARVRSQLPWSVLQFVEVPLDTTATLTHTMDYGQEHVHNVFQSLQLSNTEQNFDRVSSGPRSYIRTEKPVPIWGYYFTNDYTAVISSSAARPAEPQEFADTGKRFAPANSRIAVVAGKPVSIPSHVDIHQFGLQIASRDLNENVKLPESTKQKRAILQDPPSPSAIRPVKTLLYVLTHFTDTNGSLTLERCRWSIGNASLFFADSTYGKLKEFYTIFRFVQLRSCSSCYASHMQIEAEARTVVTDVNWSDFDHWAVLYPISGPGDFAGRAGIGSRAMWLKTVDVDIFVHEIGHNLGLGHSNFGATFNARSISRFTEREYMSPGDWLGRGRDINAHWSTGHKDRIQLLPFTSVSNPTNSGTYRLYAHDISSILGPTMPQALRIASPNFILGGTEFAYFIEFRNRTQHKLSGVSINMIRYTSYIDTFLISSVPTHTTSFGRFADDWADTAILPRGSTYVDDLLKLSITNRGTGTTNGFPWVDLEVWLPMPSSNNNPVGTISGPNNITVRNGAGSYSLSASDPDGDTLSYTWYADTNLVPAPASASSVVIVWPEAGNRTVRCHIADGKGGLSIVTYRVQVQVGSNTFSSTVVMGTVREVGTNNPIRGAQVFQTLGGTQFGVSGNDGTYTISSINNGYNVSFGISAPRHGGCTPSFTNSVPSSARLVVTGLDWTCTPLPTVSISAPTTPIANNTLATVTVSRVGSTSSSLVANIFCYAEVFGTIRMNEAAAGALDVTIASGATSATFTIRHLRPVGSDVRQMMAFCNLVESADYFQANMRVSIPLSGATGPTNDNFANAVAISGSVASHSGIFNNATAEVDEPSTKINDGGWQVCPSLWFSWVAPASGYLRLSWNVSFNCNANVYVGANLASLRSVTTRWGRSTPLQVAVVQSTQYYIHFFSCSQPIWRPGLPESRPANYSINFQLTDGFTLPPQAEFSPIFINVTQTPSGAAPSRATLNPDGSPAIGNSNGGTNAAVSMTVSWIILVTALAIATQLY